MFRNPNKCKAVTFLFHKINKLQKIRFKRVAIERRVEDPSVPTGAYQRILPDTTSRVAILPQSILANSKNRIEIEQTARKSAAERWQASASAAGFAKSGFYPSAAMPESTLSAVRESVFSNKLHNDALAKVDKDLAAAGLLNLKTGKPDEKIVGELSWKREEITPTPGVLVKGCLDECNICEPTLQREIELDLERKQLENAMLKQQIELLEKSQEYRCCPGEASSGREDEDG